MPEPKKTQNGDSTLWAFLNSQFGLWLLGSVVLSGVTFYWNQQSDARVREEKRVDEKIARVREDSQFLVSLLSYLTDSDRTARLRAVDVIRARYPDSEIPEPIANLIASCIDDQSSVPVAEQSEATKQAVSNAVQVLEKVKAPSAAVVATLQRLPPRVYLQVADSTQRKTAEALQGDLRGRGLSAPGIETVGDKAPATTEVRYYNDADQATAESVKADLEKRGVTDVKLTRPNLKASSGTVEVWFPSTKR